MAPCLRLHRASRALPVLKRKHVAARSTSFRCLGVSDVLVSGGEALHKESVLRVLPPPSKRAEPAGEPNAVSTVALSSNDRCGDARCWKGPLWSQAFWVVLAAVAVAWRPQPQVHRVGLPGGFPVADHADSEFNCTELWELGMDMSACAHARIGFDASVTKNANGIVHIGNLGIRPDDAHEAMELPDVPVAAKFAADFFAEGEPSDLHRVSPAPSAPDHMMSRRQRIEELLGNLVEHGSVEIGSAKITSNSQGKGRGKGKGKGNGMAYKQQRIAELLRDLGMHNDELTGSEAATVLAFHSGKVQHELSRVVDDFIDSDTEDSKSTEQPPARDAAEVQQLTGIEKQPSPISVEESLPETFGEHRFVTGQFEESQSKLDQLIANARRAITHRVSTQAHQFSRTPTPSSFERSPLVDESLKKSTHDVRRKPQIPYSELTGAAHVSTNMHSGEFASPSPLDVEENWARDFFSSVSDIMTSLQDRLTTAPQLPTSISSRQSSCQANPGCERLIGDCCPTTGGMWLGCCGRR